MSKSKVIFYGTCQFAGCDMDPIMEMLDIEECDLDAAAQEHADNYYGVEGWYEVIEEENDEV